jgi:hypothetical protein
MGIVILLLCLSAGLNLALWGALYRAVDGLPFRIFNLARKERAADEALALTVLQEAAAAKVGPLVQGIRAYHDQLDAGLRAQIAEAEVRARVTERRSSDAGVALSTASALVCDLRELLGLAHRRPSLPAPAGAEAPEARATVELGRRCA